MRQLARYWRPWKNANRGSMRARWRRISALSALDLPLAESAAVGGPERPEPRDPGLRSTGVFRLVVLDDEAESA
jgi:hypothetical protein